MKPSARLKTVQELLENFLNETSQPIDVLLTKHFRNNRYIGSKDRRFIQETLFEVIRNFQGLAWQAGNLGTEAEPKNLILLHLVKTDRFDEGLFGQDTYGLPALEEVDIALVKAAQQSSTGIPDWAQVNCPEWLYKDFVKRFGKNTGAELTALNQRAPLNIRLNTLQKSEEVVGELAGLGFSPAQYSPVGMTSETPVALKNNLIYREGKVEVQDEGSQLAMLLVGAKPGMQVMDMCAGAGGKALGLAAEMAGKGQIFAADISEKRLKQLHFRGEKSGVRNVQMLVLPDFDEKEERALDLKPFIETMDRVVLDVPCSGIGTWRRSPDNRLRLTQEKLIEYLKVQNKLLTEGAKAVKPGGRLVYITCSLLKSEGEGQVELFLKSTEDWKCVDYREILTDRGLEAIPETASSIPECLALTPAQHGTDGFFVAILEKT